MKPGLTGAMPCNSVDLTPPILNVMTGISEGKE